MTDIFDAPHTQSIVKARLEHLESLDLPLKGRKTLEVGAGIGNLTGWFEAQGCQVLSTDGRPSNVAEHRKRYLNRVEVVDLDEPKGHDRFGVFDLVVCYGILYHVRNPGQVLEDLARVCSGILLLETEVYAKDDWGSCKLPEGDGLDQSLCGFSVRLGRGKIMDRLQRYFPFVYLVETRPDHPWFPLEWPADQGRAVFVASRTELLELC